MARKRGTTWFDSIGRPGLGALYCQVRQGNHAWTAPGNQIRSAICGRATLRTAMV